jgi:hypothetical protein
MTVDPAHYQDVPLRSLYRTAGTRGGATLLMLGRPGRARVDAERSVLPWKRQALRARSPAFAGDLPAEGQAFAMGLKGVSLRLIKQEFPAFDTLWSVRKSKDHLWSPSIFRGFVSRRPHHRLAPKHRIAESPLISRAPSPRAEGRGTPRDSVGQLPDENLIALGDCGASISERRSARVRVGLTTTIGHCLYSG